MIKFSASKPSPDGTGSTSAPPPLERCCVIWISWNYMDLFHNEFEETYGTIIDLTPPHSHSVPVPKTGPGFGVQWFEARGGIRFVDIGGIVVHLFLDILFIIVVRSVVIDTKYGQSYQFGSQTWWGVYSIHYLIKKNCCSVTCYRSLHGSLLVLLYSMHYVHGSKIITFVHRIIPVSFHCLATWCIM